MPDRLKPGMWWMTAFAILASACVKAPGDVPPAATVVTTPAAAVPARVAPAPLPAGGDDAAARLAASPRHSEWAMIRAGGTNDSVRAFVVYPERSTKAPVIVVIHEVYGLTTWLRAVADQLAADGFIAIAPDLLTGRIPSGLTEQQAADSARATMRTVDPEWMQRSIGEIARYGMALPAAEQRYGVVGFCWGGATSFAHAVHSPSLGAAVVYYGASPPPERLASVRAPVLGLYAGEDARVNASIPAADSAMRALGRSYEKEIYAGAGHGFLRLQSGQNGANLEAARQAWPRTLAFLRRHLGE